MKNNAVILENLNKKTDLFGEDIKKITNFYDEVQKKKLDLSQREKALLKEKEDLMVVENKLESDFIALVKTMHLFQKEAITVAGEMYKRAQAEANYRAQAEAAQRALTEAAQKVLTEAAQRAKAEAEYRAKAEAAQRLLIEQAEKAQAEAAKRIQAELAKSAAQLSKLNIASEEKIMESTDINVDTTPAKAHGSGTVIAEPVIEKISEKVK